MHHRKIIFFSLIGALIVGFGFVVHKSKADEVKIVAPKIMAQENISSEAAPPAPALTDSDNDGLSDQLETTVYHTDPNNADTDGDGFSDADEIKNGYSPLQPKLKLNEVDTDQDGLSDDWELKLGSDLAKKDTDNDGYSDSEEVRLGYSPTSIDPNPVEKKIEVDIKDFKLKYNFNNIELASVPVSTGLKDWPTPTGEFEIQKKVPSRTFGGKPYSFYYPDTKWNLEFTTKVTNGIKLKYYIHGAYWHDQFGKKNVSSGCVNVAYKDMEPLYNFASVGTKLSIH